MFPCESLFKPANPRFKQGVLGGVLEGFLGDTLVHDPGSVKRDSLGSRRDFSARHWFPISCMLTRQRLGARIGAFLDETLVAGPFFLLHKHGDRSIMQF